MYKLFRFSKLEKIVDSFKGFGFGVVSLNYLFARIFFRKVMYIAAALTIFMPCFFEPISVNATEIVAKYENGLLVSADSIKEDITNPFSGLDAGPINKKLSVEKFNFWPKSISDFSAASLKMVRFSLLLARKFPVTTPRSVVRQVPNMMTIV